LAHTFPPWWHGPVPFSAEAFRLGPNTCASTTAAYIYIGSS
jgi:hypothetical protein